MEFVLVAIQRLPDLAHVTVDLVPVLSASPLSLHEIANAAYRDQRQGAELNPVVAARGQGGQNAG